MSAAVFILPGSLSVSASFDNDGPWAFSPSRKRLRLSALWLLGLRALLRLRPLRHEVRLVAQVNDDHAVQFAALQLRLAPSGHGSHVGPVRPSQVHSTAGCPSRVPGRQSMYPWT